MNMYLCPPTGIWLKIAIFCRKKGPLGRTCFQMRFTSLLFSGVYDGSKKTQNFKHWPQEKNYGSPKREINP